MITKEQAIALGQRHRAILHHVTKKGGDKKPVRCRVNGACKTWATRPDYWELPVKYGLKTCFYITPSNAAHWEIAE